MSVSREGGGNSARRSGAGAGQAVVGFARTSGWSLQSLCVARGGSRTRMTCPDRAVGGHLLGRAQLHGPLELLEAQGAPCFSTGRLGRGAAAGRAY